MTEGNIVDDYDLHSRSDLGSCSKESTSKRRIEDFELCQILDEGKFGKVYCAIDKHDRRPYAIKVLDKYQITKVRLY